MKYSSVPVVVVIGLMAIALPVLAQNTPVAPVAKSTTNTAAPQLMEWNDQWRGPLPIENERPYQAIFLHIPAQNPDVLSRGESRLGLQMDIANDYLIPKVSPNGATVTEDFETQRLKVSWSKGIGRDMEYGIGANLTARNGGILDGAVDSVHRLFNTTGFNFGAVVPRNSVPRNRSILTFQNAAGQGISEGNAFGLGDTKLWLKKQLSRNEKFSSAATVALKIPTGSAGHVTGSGSFDAGVSLDARYRLARRFALFGNLGLAGYSHSSIPGAENTGLWGAVGYEWKVGKSDSVIGQINYAKRSVTTGNSFADRSPTVASIGYKKQINSKRAYWLTFTENGDYHNYKYPWLFNIGPDITISFGYEFKR